MEIEGSGGKRKRDGLDDEVLDGRDGHVQMHHLPDVVLKSVASFLDFAERVQLAMMLPTWHCELTHDVTKAIVGAAPVEEIEFASQYFHQNAHNGSLEIKSFTDKDVRQILVSIDAVNTLKILRFTHCHQLEGHGLDPLRGSRVLERIDLSFCYRHQFGAGATDICLSMEDVIPILNSIIDADGCQLKHIQLPVSWNETFSDNEEFSHFMSTYNNLPYRCDKCHTVDLDRGALLQNLCGIESRTC
jgi:hypothetical protein